MNLIEFHVMGGIMFMLPLALLFASNLVLIGVAAFREATPKLLEIIKQIGLFALAWGAFGTLVGLFQAFGDISTMSQALPMQVISGGLKVALITVLYGFGIYLFTLAALTVLAAQKKSRS
jgi:biopolymer transport protein ExbB/TolQ